MARTRSKRAPKSGNAEKQPNTSTRDEDEQDQSDTESPDIMEKDQVEEKLDKLVLGDGAGFLNELVREGDEPEGPESEADLEADVGLGDERESLAGVDDADVGIKPPLERLLTDCHIALLS